MPQAIVQDGQIRLLEPMPDNWKDGAKLRVDIDLPAEDSVLSDELDEEFRELNEMCQAADPDKHAQLERALDQAKIQAKECMRREMGLP